MKAIISNKIYLSAPDSDTSKHIIKALTYKFTQKTGGSKLMMRVETVKNYKVLPKGILSIPQGRQDLIPDGYVVEDRRVRVPVPWPDPVSPLRPDQQEVYDAVSDSCFVNALPGWGKTYTALHIAHKLGQKTLVVTHTTTLRDQWSDEIYGLFGHKPGVIGSGSFDYEDHFIVVANIQTLVKHAATLSKEFGTIILDEAHHCPASTFTSVVDLSHARYRIALSGTMQRKDGKHVLFEDFFGAHVLKPKQSNTINPVIKLVKTNRTLLPGATWVEKINDLTQDESYRHFIAQVARTYVAKGHSVLVIADRVEFLEKVSEYVGETCLLVTGNSTYEERVAAKQQLLSREKMCVAGSRQIFSEGVSINILSCLILAVPISNDSLLEQIAGRIMRTHPGKLDPIILDMQFAGWADKKQNNDRLSFYMRKGWEIQSI
jgi:superfamily II DNA or RNA helicase